MIKSLRTSRLVAALALCTLLGESLLAQGPGRAGGIDKNPNPSRSARGGSGAGGSPLPEPVTVALVGLGVGGIGLAVLRRRRTVAPQSERPAE